MQKIRGILFDFDGTLANTIDLIVAAFEHTFKVCLGRQFTREEIVSGFGLPLGEAMAKYAPTPDMVDAMRGVYRDFNMQHHDDMIKTIPGVLEAVAKLSAAGYKMAVVTSKKTPMAKRGLKCCGLDKYITTIVGCDDTARNKPHPEPMLVGARLLGLTPGECICIGDSPFDLQSGHNAGAVTVAVRYTSFAWDKMLAEGKPDYVIDNMLELPGLIDLINSKANDAIIKGGIHNA